MVRVAADEFVWVIEAHEGYGEGAWIDGVYASEEAARAALEKRTDVEVYTQDGQLAARPVDEEATPRMYAVVSRYQVER